MVHASNRSPASAPIEATRLCWSTTTPPMRRLKLRRQPRLDSISASCANHVKGGAPRDGPDSRPRTGTSSSRPTQIRCTQPTGWTICCARSTRRGGRGQHDGPDWRSGRLAESGLQRGAASGDVHLPIVLRAPLSERFQLRNCGLRVRCLRWLRSSTERRRGRGFESARRAAGNHSYGSEAGDNVRPSVPTRPAARHVCLSADGAGIPCEAT